jgi:hypothetical protein
VTNGDQLLHNYDDYRKAYRESAQALHPDRGGPKELFQSLGEVARVLEEHHHGTMTRQ